MDGAGSGRVLPEVMWRFATGAVASGAMGTPAECRKTATDISFLTGAAGKLVTSGPALQCGPN